MKRLVPARTVVVVVDIQERLAAAMPPDDLAAVLRATRILVESARALGAPVVATEQYPKGLGPTLPDVRAALDAAAAPVLEKLAFSACDSEGFTAHLAQRPALEAAVVLGMESHVCVYQTVRDLVARGLTVHVPIDGVASRRADHREAGLELCVRAGGVRTTAESVAFDWLARAGGDEFKLVSKLVR
ncbi:MAG: isochorismatase family protein [Polyangiaceae bacterium]|nr:isochorismatase family protein [Polyangiaceae bacterium]